MISDRLSETKDIVTAFESIDYVSVETVIDAYGFYGSGDISEESAKGLVLGIMGCLGIDGTDCQCTASSGVVTATKNSGSGNATVRLIDENGNGKYYVAVNLIINNRTDCAITYQKMVEELFDAAGIEASYINMNLRGEIAGALNYYERNHIANRFLEMLDAKVVVENRDNSLFTIYAYSDKIDRYVLSAGRKVNVNIAETYDEVKNCTIIYLSTPINNLDY